MSMQYGIVIPNIGSYADSFWLIDRACEAEERGWDGFFCRIRCILKPSAAGL